MKSKLIVPAIILTLLTGIFIGHSKSGGETKEVASLNLLEEAFRKESHIDEDRTKAMANINDQITILKADVQILNDELKTVKEKAIVNVLPPALKVPEKKVTIKEKPKETLKEENEIPIEEIVEEPKEARIISKNNYVNMRSGPGIHNSVVAQVTKDQSFTILTEKNEWYQVKLSDGQVGWIARWIVRPTGN